MEITILMLGKPAIGLCLPQVKARRLYDDDKPNGYLEGDNDFVKNNHELCVKILEALTK